MNGTDRFNLQIIGVLGEQVTVTVGHSESLLGKIDIFTAQCKFTGEKLSTMEITCETTSGCRCDAI